MNNYSCSGRQIHYVMHFLMIFTSFHYRRMDILEYPSMSSEVRGVMAPGILKLTDAKLIFVHSKSGRKDTVKVIQDYPSRKKPLKLTTTNTLDRYLCYLFH